jgi:hypothetical protein
MAFALGSKARKYAILLLNCSLVEHFATNFNNPAVAKNADSSKAIPNCPLYVMKDCLCWPQKERPEEFSRT